MKPYAAGHILDFPWVQPLIYRCSGDISELIGIYFINNSKRQICHSGVQICRFGIQPPYDKYVGLAPKGLSVIGISLLTPTAIRQRDMIGVSPSPPKPLHGFVFVGLFWTS